VVDSNGKWNKEDMKVVEDLGMIQPANDSLFTLHSILSHSLPFPHTATSDSFCYLAADMKNLF
jgi:hypothetical protein